MKKLWMFLLLLSLCSVAEATCDSSDGTTYITISAVYSKGFLSAVVFTDCQATPVLSVPMWWAITPEGVRSIVFSPTSRDEIGAWHFFAPFLQLKPRDDIFIDFGSGRSINVKCLNPNVPGNLKRPELWCISNQWFDSK